MTSNNIIEESTKFAPQFDNAGLIPAIAQDAESGEVLMVAYMNEESLRQTIESGQAVYFSRSRKKLWKKGEQSGHIQKVEQILVDCDQDCIVLKVRVDAGQCHTGHRSCFYRALAKDSTDQLEFIAEKVYDPGEVYGK